MFTYDLSDRTSAEAETSPLSRAAFENALSANVAPKLLRAWWRLGLWTLMLASIALDVTPTPSVAQNLIVNGGFEPPSCVNGTNTCTGWSLTATAFGHIVVDSSYAHLGSQGLLNNYTAGSGFATTTAQQTVTPSRAGIYNFSFWYNVVSVPMVGAGTATASIGGQVVFNQTYTSTYSPINTYQPYSTSIRLPAGATNVVFNTSANLPALLNEFYWALDDVSLMFLNAGTLSLPQGLPTNQTNVGNAINNFINAGGMLSTSLSNLPNLSGTQLQTALTQLDGEAATDAEKGAFALMNQFLGLMLDPFVDGRFGTTGGPIGFAPDQQASFRPDIALAYASVLKAPPPQSFDQRWTAWGSGFGASSTTNGNAAIGSNNVTAADYGFAAGMDYHVTPSTLYGFALAGAGTNWNLAQGLGSGRSDAFQAGVYGKSYWGPAYVAAALAFTNNWFSTNRTVLGDELTANFAGQSYGGRLESGYRYGVPVSGGVIGAAPYAAIQTQWFHTPTNSETDLAGGGLGLTYNAMTANDTRSELGARFDDPTLLNGMPLILRARLAWAHDWVTNPALNAVFQSLPASSFIVNGAAPPKDSALASAGAQYFLSSALSFTAKFDSEFASSSQTYGGSGTLRYTW